MNILYIDDDSEDREFFKEAVSTIDPSSVCYTANDGKQGFDELDKLIVTPDFIFVDMNMPIMNGRQFVAEIKKIPHLKSIPVIIYSTTSHYHEMKEYFALGAHKVLVKPNSFKKVCELLLSVVKESTPTKFA